MTTTILLDHDVEGHTKYLQASLRDTGWDRDFTIEFVRLRDLELPDDSSDQGIWRFAQQHRLLLLTNNRNQENETSPVFEGFHIPGSLLCICSAMTPLATT